MPQAREKRKCISLPVPSRSGTSTSGTASDTFGCLNNHTLSCASAPPIHLRLARKRIKQQKGNGAFSPLFIPQLKRPIHQRNSPLFTYEAIGLASFFCLQKACSRRQVLFSMKSHFAVLCLHYTSGLSKFFSSSKNKCLFKRESRRTRQYLTYQPYQARQKPILELQDD